MPLTCVSYSSSKQRHGMCLNAWLRVEVPSAAVLIRCGCCVATGKTLTAPLDRVKLLLQTRGGLQGGALKAAARGGGVWDALVVIGREEGFLGYWKGNVPQVCPSVLSPSTVDFVGRYWAMFRGCGPGLNCSDLCCVCRGAAKYTRGLRDPRTFVGVAHADRYSGNNRRADNSK